MCTKLAGKGEEGKGSIAVKLHVLICLSKGSEAEASSFCGYLPSLIPNHICDLSLEPSTFRAEPSPHHAEHVKVLL